MFTRWIDLRVAGILLIVCLGVGCASQKPAPLASPRLTVNQTHYLGDAVSGPQAGKPPADPVAGAMVAHVQFYAATEIATDKLDPLGTGARLVLSPRDKEPMLATSRLTATARWGTSSAAESFATQLDVAPPKQVVKWRDTALLIPLGVTTAVDASDDPGHQSLRLLISNEPKAQPSQCEISLGSESEQVVLRALPVGNGLTVALAIPFEPTGSPAKFLAAIVSVSPPPTDHDASFAAMVDTCNKDMQRENAAAEQRLKQRLTAQPTGTWPAFDAARQAAQDPKARRAAMVYLAAQAGADFSRNAYLVADDAALSRMLDDVAKRVAADQSSDRSDAALAWLLDCSTCQILAKSLSGNQLSPQLQTVLTDFAGEAGRNPSSMDQITRNLTSRADLDKRLLTENRIYLEDGSPAARVRAFDWLKSRGKAPNGFDPLGSPRARRDALQAS
jgi:hypothetical protein